MLLRSTCIGVVAALLLTGSTLTAAELKINNVAARKGNGPDGKGNTADDTWQFWFELAHKPGEFRRFTRHSSQIPAAGIRRKVTGPPAGLLPHPKETLGWVLHTDWDARYEGIRADKKTGEVLAHPYVEKRAHMGVAITYLVGADGVYTISGAVTDVQVKPEFAKHDGIIWKVEIAKEGAAVRKLGQGKPVGDGHGRPESDKFNFPAVKLNKGQLVRLVIHPNKWWGQDLTRIDAFKIERKKRP